MYHIHIQAGNSTLTIALTSGQPDLQSYSYCGYLLKVRNSSSYVYKVGFPPLTIDPTTGLSDANAFGDKPCQHVNVQGDIYVSGRQAVHSSLTAGIKRTATIPGHADGYRKIFVLTPGCQYRYSWNGSAALTEMSCRRVLTDVYDGDTQAFVVHVPSNKWRSTALGVLLDFKAAAYLVTPGILFPLTGDASDADMIVQDALLKSVGTQVKPYQDDPSVTWTLPDPNPKYHEQKIWQCWIENQRRRIVFDETWDESLSELSRSAISQAKKNTSQALQTVIEFSKLIPTLLVGRKVEAEKLKSAINEVFGALMRPDYYLREYKTFHKQWYRAIDGLAFSGYEQLTLHEWTGKYLQITTRRHQDAVNLLRRALSVYFGQKWGTPLTVREMQKLLDSVSDDLTRMSTWSSCERTRSRRQVSCHYAGSSSVPVQATRHLKVYYDPQDSREGKWLKRLFDYNILSLDSAWDYVPYSFVVDWFVNLGDRLQVLDNTWYRAAFQKIYGCIITQRVESEIDLAVLSKMSAHDYSGRLQVTDYVRTLRDTVPLPSTLSVASGELGFDQYFDGALLITQVVIK